jgi:hypothetical protein
MTNFFRINMPYGITRNENGEWTAFNREYMPIGFNNAPNFRLEETSPYPIHTRYKGLEEKTLLSLASKDEHIKRNESGEIIGVWLYDDGTNPNYGSEASWNAYFDKLKILAKLETA